MEALCNETYELLQYQSQASSSGGVPTADFNYQIDGLNLQSFYEQTCLSGNNNGTSSNSSFNASEFDEKLEEFEELYDPEYFSHTYRIVGTFFQGIIFLVGLLGNIMVVIVVAKTKSMHSPTNCYLVSLAIADIIVLLAAVPNEILSYYLIGGKWVYGELACALFVFSQNLGINASTLSLTAFTVERYIAICHPMKAQTICTVSRAKKIIGGVWLCSIIYCSPWLGLTSLTKLPYKGFDDVKKCTFKLSREAYTYYYLTDFFVFYVVPLLLSVVLYGLIARILFQSHSIKTNSGGGGGTGTGKSSNGCGTLTVDSTKTNAARVQVVKMLVMVVVIFAVLWLPYRGMLVYNSFATMFRKETFMDLWFLMLVKTCIYINSAINPILYNAMSVKFRRAFSRTLFCGKQRSGSSFNTYGAYYGRGTHTTYSTATITTTFPPHSNLLSSSAAASNSNSNSAGAAAAAAAAAKKNFRNKQYQQHQQGGGGLLSAKNNHHYLKHQEAPLIQYRGSKNNPPGHHLNNQQQQRGGGSCGRHSGSNYDSMEMKIDMTDTIYTCHDSDQQQEQEQREGRERTNSSNSERRLPAIVDYDDDFIDGQVVTEL